MLVNRPGCGENKKRTNPEKALSRQSPFGDKVAFSVFCKRPAWPASFLAEASESQKPDLNRFQGRWEATAGNSKIRRGRRAAETATASRDSSRLVNRFGLRPQVCRPSGVCTAIPIHRSAVPEPPAPPHNLCLGAIKTAQNFLQGSCPLREEEAKATRGNPGWRERRRGGRGAAHPPGGPRDPIYRNF